MQVGQRFSFELEWGPQGKKRTAKVLPIRQIKPLVRQQKLPTKGGTATLLAIPAFLLLYLTVAVVWRPSALVAVYYAVASLATFLVYALDKAAAKRRDQRTPEKTLHLMSLAGGWPGALLAQQYLRHKSAKLDFRFSFWLTVVLNVLVFVLLCSPFLRSQLLRILSAQ